MTKKIYQKLILGIIVVSVLLLISPLVLARGWYQGDLHQHTGFSSIKGYEGVSLSQCLKEPNPTGYTITELKDFAKAQGIDWLSFTDHSYCLNSGEFDTVESECNSVINVGSCVCSSGEELSAERCVNP